MFYNLSLVPYGEFFKFIDFDFQKRALRLQACTGGVGRRVAILLHGYLCSPNGLVYLSSFLKDGLHLGNEKLRYDSILFYKYNSLPSIKDIALHFDTELKKLLVDGCSIDLYAHSMGGLVSRWWVERLGGGRFVQRLITFGTPHSGILVNKYEKIFQLVQEKFPLGLSVKEMICVVTEDSVYLSPFLKELNEPCSSFADDVDYYTFAGNRLRDFGNPLVQMLLKNLEQTDGLVHVSSAHSSCLESKSSSWKRFPVQRATFDLNHVELVMASRCSLDALESHLPFAQLKEWAMEWK